MSDSHTDPSDDDSSVPSSGERRPLVRRFGYKALIAFVLIDALVLAGVGIGVFRGRREIASLQPPSPQGSLVSPYDLPSPSPTTPPLRPCDQPTLIGTVSVDAVVARAAPHPDARIIGTLLRKNLLGIPQVLDLVKEVSVGSRKWYKALLPVRPNGTIGYIPAKAISIATTTYRLKVDRSKFRLSLYRGCKRLETFPVGIGTGATPTPVGRFYLTGLFKPPEATTIYGVSIYTLSGFSEVLTNWRMGGIIGLHGTNDPSSIGRNSSHGCIRMRNEDILKLVKFLPLGTPIIIR